MKKPAALVLLLLAAPWTAKAGVGVWTPFGPGVPDVAHVVAAPGSLYALVPGDGIFRSRDDGESWQWWSLGIGRAWSVQVHYFAVDATQPLDLYAATFDQKIERSFDGGRTWVRVEPIPGDPPGILTVAGAGGTFYAGTVLGLYALRDGGWTRLLEDTVWSLAFGPGALYAGTEQALKKSTDGGLTWSALLSGAQIESVAVAPSDPSTIYAVGYGQVQASTDGGATWVKRPLLASYQVAVNPAASNHVVAAHGQGLSWSDDGGATWHQTSSYLGFSVAADPGRPGTFSAATLGGGVQVSHDGGRTWHSPVGRGLGWILTTFVARDPAEPGTFYLCRVEDNEPSCFQSLDGGSTWRSWDVIRVPTRPRLDAMAFDRRDPDVLYAAGQGVFQVEGELGVALPLFPLQAREALRGVAVNRGILVTGGRAGVYRSLNRGLGGWKRVLFGDLQRLTQDPDDPAVLYAIVLEQVEPHTGPRFALYRSLDAGGHWIRLLVDTPALAVDPSRPRTLYTVLGDKTYRSRDRGATWRPVGESPGRQVLDLVVHPQSPAVLLAGTWGDGVRISREGGRSWAPYNAGLARPGIEDILKLYPDPAEPGRFFALPGSGGTFEITVD